MGRALRIQEPNCIYHVINRGNKRATIFYDDDDLLFMRSLILRAKKKYAVRIYSYTLMPNHFHLLLETEKRNALSAFMKDISFKFAKKFNNKRNKDGHVWQGRYHSFVVEKDEYFLQCMKYIELNPTRAGIVLNPEEFPWSSYRFHAFGNPDPLVDTHELFQSLGRTPLARRVSYQVLLANNTVLGRGARHVPGTKHEPVDNQSPSVKDGLS